LNAANTKDSCADLPNVRCTCMVLYFADAAIRGPSGCSTLAAGANQPNNYSRSKCSIKAWVLFVLSLQPSA